MFLRFNLLTIFWGFLLFLAGLIPGKFLTPDYGFWGLGVDKAGHMLLYGIFELLLVIGFAKQYTFQMLMSYPMGYSTVVAFGYGFLLELLQIPISGRRFEWLDLLANAAGILLGAFIYWFFYSDRSKPR